MFNVGESLQSLQEEKLDKQRTGCLGSTSSTGSTGCLGLGLGRGSTQPYTPPLLSAPHSTPLLYCIPCLSALLYCTYFHSTPLSTLQIYILMRPKRSLLVTPVIEIQ